MRNCYSETYSLFTVVMKRFVIGVSIFIVIPAFALNADLQNWSFFITPSIISIAQSYSYPASGIQNSRFVLFQCSKMNIRLLLGARLQRSRAAIPGTVFTTAVRTETCLSSRLRLTCCRTSVFIRTAGRNTATLPAAGPPSSRCRSGWSRRASVSSTSALTMTVPEIKPQCVCPASSHSAAFSPHALRRC